MESQPNGVRHGFSIGAGYALVQRVIAPIILLSLPLLLWWWLGPEKPSSDRPRNQLAQAVTARVAERIRQERGDVRRAEVLHFANDPTDCVTDALRKNLLNSGFILDMGGTPSSEKVRSLINLRNDGSFDSDRAIDYAKEHQLDAVIIGVVDRFETVNGVADLMGKVKFISLLTGKTVDIPMTKEGLADDPAPVAEGALPYWQLILLGLAGMILLPIVLFPLLKRVMRRDSNLATGGLLLFLTAGNVTAVWLIVGFGTSVSGMVIPLIMLAVGLGYDLFMLSFAQLCRPELPEID